MRRFVGGVFVGVFLCVSFFEVIHRTVEISATKSRISPCNFFYYSLTKAWPETIVYDIKIVYKVFAWPVKTIWILFSPESDSLAMKDAENGEWSEGRIRGADATGVNNND